MRIRTYLATLVFVSTIPVVSSIARAQPSSAETRSATDDRLDELERNGAVVGEISIRVGNIFDPQRRDENRRIFRAANRVHRTTRDSVIEEILLIRPGDPLSRRKIEESERLLRATRYLFDPEIRIVQVVGERVDLEVVTRDLWTLKAGGGVGRSGGVNSTHFQLKDANLFGTGKSVDFEHSTTVDRTSTLVQYADPNVLGSRTRLSLDFASNSDGNRRSFDLERPFYELDSRWAAGVKASSDDRVDSLYQLGHVSEAFRHREERFEVFGGRSREGAAELDASGRVHRWTVGFSFERDRFERDADRVRPTALPPDRTLAYPWIGFDAVSGEFLKTQNFDQIGRAEDLSLGKSFHVRLGWSSPALGGDRDEMVFESKAAWGVPPLASTERLLLFSGTASGRLGEGGTQNLLVSGRARLSWRDFGDQLFLATVEGSAARKLDPERQLLLGGDSGLRGYPLRFQEGDRRLLVSLEQRIFTDWYPWQLFHVGAAVFYDAGQTWSTDEAKEARIRGLLQDVGFGLRLGSSRSALGSVLHLDVAFPLQRAGEGGSIRAVQFLVSSRTGF